MASVKKKKTSPKKKIVKRKPAKKVARKRPARKAVKQKPAKKPALKKPVPKTGGIRRKKEAVIGEITHYFPKVRAAVVKLKVSLLKGDTVKIKGHTTDFVQTVNSLQIDHVPVEKANKGDEIGLLVNSRVRQKDKVYKAQ